MLRALAAAAVALVFSPAALARPFAELCADPATPAEQQHTIWVMMFKVGVDPYFDAAHCREVLDACERLVAARPEVEVLSARQQLFGPEDEGVD